jgi:putative transposase
VPHYPHHIIQRGHNRQVIFAQADDYTYYLSSLRAWKTHYQIKVYAYCLMTNHVHLLLEPGDEPGTLGQFMKRVAARQTRYVNRLESRSGTLWESRYKSSPVETESYLLACARYIELNPVRAQLVAQPEDYPWSSFQPRIGQRQDPWLDIDPVYLSLGRTPQQRARRYHDFVSGHVAQEEWQLIRDAIQRGQLTGGDRFIEEIKAIMGKRIERRGQGRPKKETEIEK